jgi:KaiC/GvpD/RAD55 family RecA-like ATPase
MNLWICTLAICLILSSHFIAVPQVRAESTFFFNSIQSVVDIVSPRLAHVTRAVSITFGVGNWTYLDWGLWYEGKDVQVTNASDATGKLGFIYPLPGSDPTRPVLRILFSKAINGNLSYNFSYQYEVTSSQDSFSWSETLDASQIPIESLIVTILLPEGYQPTGLQPSSATEGQQNGRNYATWSGTNLVGVSDVGLTVGFAQQTSSTSASIMNLLPYAAIGVTLFSVAAYGFTRFQMGRKKRRAESYSVLEKEAREAAAESPRAVVPTGVPPLDYLLNGGLPAGTATLLTSPACDERDMILRRVIETGINSGGECLYLGKDASKVEDLIASAPLKLKVVVTRGDARAVGQSNVKVTGVDLSTINIDLMALLQGAPTEASKRLCIDLLDDLLLLHKSALTRRWLTQLLPRVKGLGYTVLATLNSQMHSSADLQAIVELFEGHIQLTEKAVNDKSRMVLRVQKMFRWKFLDTEAVLDRNKIM